MAPDKKKASRFVLGTDPQGTEASSIASMADILASSTVFAQLKKVAEQHGGWVPLSDIARVTDSRKDTARYRLRNVSSKYVVADYKVHKCYCWADLAQKLEGQS